MKKQLNYLLLVLGVLVIGMSSCSKKQNTVQTVTSTTVDILGTWYNPNDNTDYFTVKDTTNSNTNIPRYYIVHYKYTNGLNNKFVTKSELTTLPGAPDSYTMGSVTYDVYLSFVDNSMRLTGTPRTTGSNLVINYTKQ